MKTLFAFIIVTSSTLFGQEFSKAIEDNSFYIEEAYNQEEHVVQHILNGVRFSQGNMLETGFTQEWPAFGPLHQVSFTVPMLMSYGLTPSSQGVGDLMIHYRYQLTNENGLAVSPRASLILPTGDETKGFGTGVAGIQLNLPVSKRWSNGFVTHYNAGLTYHPNAPIGTGKADYSEYFAGASAIILMQDNLNLMTEVLYTSSGSSFGRTGELIVSPGLRGAVDIGELQIVPGIAFPFTFSSGVQNNGIFFYVSFEHPY